MKLTQKRFEMYKEIEFLLQERDFKIEVLVRGSKAIYIFKDPSDS